MVANVQVWKNGLRCDDIFGFRSGSCNETRKSPSAGVKVLGDHALKAYTRKQKHIARSSAEAEMYAAASGASESEGFVSLLKDLGHEMKTVLAIDEKATENTLHRQGTGRLKHIDVAHLWMQDEVRSKRLRVRRVKSEENVADLSASKGAQQNSYLEALHHAGVCQHG